MNRLLSRLALPFILILPVIWLLLIFIAINFTSPLLVGPAGILAVFIMFYAFFSSALYLMLYLMLWIWKITTGKELVNPTRLYYLVSVIALGPIFLLALNTLGQLGLVELVLVTLLVVIASFYTQRRSRS